jgi:hypothetical protein
VAFRAARYFFYSADLYYFDAVAGSAPSRIGDYQGVLDIDDDSLTPGQVFSSLLAIECPGSHRDR